MCSNLSIFRIDKSSVLAQEIREGDETFEDVFWSWFLKPGLKAFVFGGTAYGYETAKRISQEHDRLVWLKSEKRAIVCLKTWVLGRVPPSIADNAVFIGRQQFERLRERTVPCNLKGCFDRYHCHWYDAGTENGDPWNEIPQDWVAGDEKCESFVLKSLLKE